jgi:hypothetical protein
MSRSELWPNVRWAPPEDACIWRVGTRPRRRVFRSRGCGSSDRPRRRAVPRRSGTRPNRGARTARAHRPRAVASAEVVAGAGCRLDAAPGSVRGRLLCPALDASLRGGRQPLTGCQRSGASAWGLREFGFHGLSHSWVAGAGCLRPAQTACGSSPGTSEWGLCAIRTAVDRHHDVSHAARGPGDGRPLWQRQSGAASFMAARARGDRR